MGRRGAGVKKIKPSYRVGSLGKDKTKLRSMGWLHQSPPLKAAEKLRRKLKVRGWPPKEVPIEKLFITRVK